MLLSILTAQLPHRSHFVNCKFGSANLFLCEILSVHCAGAIVQCLTYCLRSILLDRPLLRGRLSIRVVDIVA